MKLSPKGRSYGMRASPLPVSFKADLQVVNVALSAPITSSKEAPPLSIVRSYPLPEASLAVVAPLSVSSKVIGTYTCVLSTMPDFLAIVHQTYSSSPGVGITVLHPAGSVAVASRAGGSVVDPFLAYLYSKYSPAAASVPADPESPLILAQVYLVGSSLSICS